jgi:hypothetical protein
MVTGGPPDTINDRHKLMALDRAMGATYQDIADKYDYAYNRISIIFQHPLMRELVAKYQGEIAGKATEKAANLAVRLDGLAPRAVDKLAELMDKSEMDTVQLAASKEILDRAPSAPKARKVVESDQRGVVLQLPVATLENMLKASQIVGEPLDAEFKEITGEEEDECEG